MLRTLSIRDVVLIGRLDLTFHSGLCVLTGETGAGKSILLDALGLALGARADARLVRHGADQATVTAVFDVPAGHRVRRILIEAGLDSRDEDEGDEALVLRRGLGADGRSRAFVNDAPVSVALLKRIGDTLVEIHGQFDNQRLLNPAAHRGLLDAYGGLKDQAEKVSEAWARWSAARRTAADATEALAAARRDEDYLRHAVGEIEALAPEPGEDATLTDRRALLMHADKIVEALNEAAVELNQGRGVEASLRAALGAVERAAGRAEGSLDGVVAALDRALAETVEAADSLGRAAGGVDTDPRSLESIEERLFALKALARKHHTDIDGLPALAGKMAAALAAVDDGAAALGRLKAEQAAARAAFEEAAERLGRGREKAARRLDKAVAAELDPLKLGRAVFATAVEALEEKDWGESGRDRVVFRVATNPGQPPGPLARIASGGELARFVLAIKAVLADADPVSTIVFDEVDSGIGGAVAAAVGERLARLGDGAQVLVVTHSPQVAAVGTHHWRVSKADAGAGVLTTVDPLSEATRTEEIARMLAGARITDEARAAAASLLGGGAA